jgi:hypothetical protein
MPQIPRCILELPRLYRGTWRLNCFGLFEACLYSTNLERTLRSWNSNGRVDMNGGRLKTS